MTKEEKNWLDKATRLTSDFFQIKVNDVKHCRTHRCVRVRRLLCHMASNQKAISVQDLSKYFGKHQSRVRTMIQNMDEVLRQPNIDNGLLIAYHFIENKITQS